jgi:trk system potassium uptake protein TrkH
MRTRFQTLRVVFKFLGSLLIALGCMLLLPLVLVLWNGEIEHDYGTLLAFLLPAALSFLLGLSCRTFFKNTKPPSNLQSILIVGLGWIVFSAVGALPFVIGINSSYLNGYFEAMSGFTTTGITMFSGLDDMPRSILFWRSLTQWIGGMGILTFFLAVTYQGGSTHRLFGAESHKIEMGRPVPSLAGTVKILLGIYIGFSVVIAASLFLAGMSPFDSIAHSMTTVSTGGFSPYDASIEYYRMSGHPHYVWIEYIIILGMVAGGTSFLIHYRVLKGSWQALFDNTEVRYWWGLIGLFVLIILSERLIRLETFTNFSLTNLDFWRVIEEDFRIVLFQVIAIITTTGFGTRDIAGSFFGTEARELFLIMMVIGGCVGSTGGGFKVLRIAILMKLIQREIYRLRTPIQAISRVILDGESVELDEIQRVGGIFFAWILLLIIGGGITALFSHHSGYQAFSGMFSALGNIGPAYISVQEMGQLHPIIKITYIIGMLAGRLEILPVLVLLNPKAWQA